MTTGQRRRPRRCARGGAELVRAGALARVVVVALCCVPFSGCVSPPRAVVYTPHGLVRADEVQLAEDAAQMFLDVRDRLLRRLPDAREQPVDVWLQDRPHAGPLMTPSSAFHAFALHGTWMRRGRIHLPALDFRASLAHELVHLLLGDSWNPLPQALEEGLCDVMALLVDQSPSDLRLLRLQAAKKERNNDYALRFQLPRPGRHALRGVSAWSRSLDQDPAKCELTAFAALDLDGGGAWMRHADHDLLYAYGVGFVFAERIVERHGVQGLHALCLAAREDGLRRIPLEWIAAASGIEGEASFERLVDVELYGERVATALSSGDLGQALSRLRSRSPQHAPDLPAFLARFRPTLAIGAGPNVPLQHLPGFEAWAAAAGSAVFADE